MAAVEARDSLVRYDAPTVLKGKAAPLPPARGLMMEGGAVPSTDVLLNAIVAPRQMTMPDGSLWLQQISGAPATRSDVVKLQETLDLRLQQRQARETGICPVREELYSQCFDELIRQVTLSCAERGLLLLRVRDEIRMTLAALQTLYESSVAFGMRRTLMAEQRKSELSAKIKILTGEISKLERSVADMQTRAGEMEAAEGARAAAEEEKHAAEVARLQAANDALRENLEGLLAPPRR